MERIVEDTELKPLEREHIELYLEKRGIEEESRPKFAELLAAITKGNPFQLANHVDALVSMRKRK
jgi:predicted ATPase